MRSNSTLKIEDKYGGEGEFWKFTRRVEARSTVPCSAGKGCWVSQGNSSTGTHPTPPHPCRSCSGHRFTSPRGDEKALVLSLPGVHPPPHRLLLQKVSSSLGCYRNNNASGTPLSLLSCLSSHMESWVAPLGEKAMWVGTFGH